ncbi:MAG: hypothetical protein OXU20_04050 [Myxococcales bacterium]|nr:hypothetical protein [Myxococcales bacterium]
MDAAGWVRSLGLGCPLVATLVAFHARPLARRGVAASLVATAWTFPALFGLNLLAQRVGWWSFDGAAGGLFFGVPLDAIVAWTVLWAVLPEIVAPTLSLPVLAGIALWLDLMVMPLGEPVIRLGESWLVGEFLAIACVLAPARLVASWTRKQAFLGYRTAVQAVSFGSLAWILIPLAAFAWTGRDPMRWLSHWSWGAVTTLAHCAGLFAALALSAVQEFVQRGHGTPMPLDPPKRLVTSGPYAYVANPMQLAMTATMIVWALLLQSWLYAGAALVAFVFSIGFTAWEESQSMIPRFGSAFEEYRAQVRFWRVRTRPYVANPARLYYGAGCNACEELAAWIRRRAVGLQLVPAQEHQSANLTRMTYESTGYRAYGVEAVARALEHVHLGWAVLGCLARLPIMVDVLQVIVDASGGGPRALRCELSDGQVEHRRLTSAGHPPGSRGVG